MAQVEETLKRIEASKGVIGTILVNAEELLCQLSMLARTTVRDIDPQNDLTFLRIRSKKHEIMVALENNYLLIVIQNPCE
ncbi:dynein light chain roadblock-type 2-like isoform X2 [Amphiprion ocellaris]|uniref:dynein light chain roadblock-type 2-like isoform X2 n=1 Tax=Amphiprion ocellaris TaxID=80972 RepID=UPI001649B325|nr:dynein light chain roadblock-type 2-like isoform X2 [Amphiprion ocellaris]